MECAAMGSRSMLPQPEPTDKPAMRGGEVLADGGKALYRQTTDTAKRFSVPSGDGGNPSPLGEAKGVGMWSRVRDHVHDLVSSVLTRPGHDRVGIEGALSPSAPSGALTCEGQVPGAVAEPGSEAIGTGSLDVGDGGPISEKGREPMRDSQLPVDNNEATGL